MESDASMHSQGCCATSLAVFSTPLGTPDLLDMLAVAVGLFACVTRLAEVWKGVCRRRLTNIQGLRVFRV